MALHHEHSAHEHADPHTHLSPTDYWEQRYADSERIWSGEVNATLAAVAGEFTPGDSIDLGCGEGGDVLWLAEQGWRAHGLDISATAVSRAREEAAARGLENASFTATDLSTWRPDPNSADLVTASFFQSNVELDRIAILRTAASALRSGGHLVVISHAAPPPWAGKNGPQMLSARDDAAQLDLPSDEWTIEAADERSRPATGPDGQHAELIDAVLVVRRR